MIIDNGSPKVSLNEVVMFPFDNQSIPISHGLRLHLLQNNNAGFDREIVLKTGDPGSPDSRLVVYYGTCLLYTSPSPRDPKTSRMPSSA